MGEKRERKGKIGELETPSRPETVRGGASQPTVEDGVESPCKASLLKHHEGGAFTLPFPSRLNLFGPELIHTVVDIIINFIFPLAHEVSRLAG